MEGGNNNENLSISLYSFEYLMIMYMKLLHKYIIFLVHISTVCSQNDSLKCLECFQTRLYKDNITRLITD